MPVDPRPAAPEIAADDTVVVFRTETSNTRGRLVRLGQTLDAIIAPHEMPDAASNALSEALTLAALCGSALPAEGNLNLQTRSNGAVSILVADYAGAGRLRGYARYDKAKLAEREQLKNPNDGGGILGTGISPSRSIPDREKSATKACLRSKARRLRPPPPHTSSSAKHCRRSFDWQSRATTSVQGKPRPQNNGGTGAPGD